MSRNQKIILLIFLTASFYRIYSALVEPYIWDEYRTWILIGQSISLNKENFHLPVHVDEHPNLPAYFIRAGGIIFGDTQLGWRFFSLVAGIWMLFVTFILVREWASETAAIFTILLLAINEYHIFISAIATEKAYYLFFSIITVYFGFKYLRTNQPKNLFFAAFLLGLGFLCNYRILILIPAFVITLIITPNRKIFLRPEVYFSFLLFLLVISIDIVWNLRNLDTTGTLNANIGDHFARIGGIGLSKQPFVFYLRDFRNVLYTFLGRKIYDAANEYPSMNSLVGAFYLLGIGYSTGSYLLVRKLSRFDFLGQYKFSQFFIFLLTWFWLLFGFFLIIKPGTPKPMMDTVVWFWVDMTIFPASAILGILFSKIFARHKYLMFVLLIILFVYSTFRVVIR